MVKKLSRQQRRAMERAQRKGRPIDSNTGLNNTQSKVDKQNLTHSNVASNPVSGWIPKGQTIEIAGRKIPGMVYFGRPQLDSGSKESHNLSKFYINPELKVADNSNSSSTEFYSEEFAYDQITPLDRANYLDWLASGRFDPSYSDEYMVLYFLGLEWAYFDKSITEEEHNNISIEIQRLFAFYHNGEFSNILSNIMEFIVNQNYYLELFNAEDCFDHPDRRKLYYHEGGIKVLNNEPLQAPHVDTILKIKEIEFIEGVRKICPYVFEQHFKAKFDEEFPRGLSIEKPEKYIDNPYKSIYLNLQINEKVKFMGKEVPDILYSDELLSIAEKIGTKVANELKPYCDEIEKNVQNITSNEKLEFLPEPNQVSVNSKFDQIVQDWVAKVLQKPDKFTVENLALFTDFESLSEDDIAPWLRIVVALERIGYGITPELGLYLYNLGPHSRVSLFKLESTPEDRQKSSGQYHSVVFSFVIGIMLAIIDDKTIDDKYLLLLSNRISAMKGLTEYETELLIANLEDLQHSDVDPFYMLKFFSDGIFVDREFVRESLKLFVKGGESVTKKNVMIILTVYKTLELDPREIISDLNLTEEIKVSLIETIKLMTKFTPNSVE